MWLIVIWLLLPGQTEAQLLGSMSQEQEVELGREAAALIEEDLVLLDDAEVVAYINRLGQELVAGSGRPDLTYTFAVVDAEEVNAFALPGGFIYVHRGLIEAADNESELAGVLGHEIGHVVARHGVDQLQRAQLVNLGLGALGALLGDRRGASVGNMAAELVANGTFMKFSRDAEREADQLGARNVASVGAAPAGMLTFFEKLDRLRAQDPNAVERFFASHPSPAERIDNLSGLVATLSASATLETDTSTFRAVRARLAALPRPARPGGGPGTADAGRPATEVETPAAADAPRALPPNPRAARDQEIAMQFAPTFYQALGSEPRFDYVTTFDFDGDWRGDNNWVNAGDERVRLPASIYHAVTETRTHYLVVYAAFHPRDYKGGNIRGPVLSEVLRDGARRVGDRDPTGLAQDAVLAHENDLEGVLVVAEKRGGDLRDARVRRVETLAHNEFLKYSADGARRRDVTALTVRGQRAVLFIEPKGHGIEAYRGDDEQLQAAENGFVIYRPSERAGEAGDGRVRQGAGRRESVGYALISLYDTLWERAQRGANETFGEGSAYASFAVRGLSATGEELSLDVAPGRLGASLRGGVGGRHMARPPWGWFDARERDRPLGEWFLDPAGTINRHFSPDEPFSLVYLHHPYLGIYGPTDGR